VSEEDAPKAIRDRNQKIRDEAAQKRKARRDTERRAAVTRNLGAAEIVDDAVARGTQAATGWLKKHFNVIQWVLLLAAAIGIGTQIYRSRAHKADAKATDALMAGVFAEFGRVGTEEATGADPSTGIEDPRQKFADDAARLKAAEEAFRSVGGSSTMKTLAQLGLAGALFDAGKSKDALAAYQAVRQSELAKKDSDVRFRSLEGVALSEEALGNKDAALKSFRELGNSDLPGFAALGLYHQGRLTLAAGERDSAKDLLKKALEKVGKPESADAPPSFVAEASKQLLASIDPNAVPQESKGLTPEQLKALMEQAAAAKKGGNSDISKEQLNEILKQAAKSAPPAPQPPASGTPASKP
jgi:hypothetical protein